MKKLINTQNFKKIINDYAATKVVDWVLRNRVDEGYSANFKWTNADKKILKDTIFKNKLDLKETSIDERKIENFISSIIENGLNSDDVKLYQKYKDRLPLRALGLAYDKEDFKIKNNKLESIKKIEAGFYMLEINILPKKYNSLLNININEMSNSKSDKVFSLTAQSGKLTKRLIFINADINISIPLNQNWNYSDLKFFKLARLTRNFFISRIYKKLGKKYDINNKVNVSDEDFNALWLEYNNIFSDINNSLLREYSEVIVEAEKVYNPSIKEQISNLNKWLSI